MMNREFNSAVSLMKMALALLDKSGDDRASGVACHLQAAIDTAHGNKPMKEGDELDSTIE